MGRTARYEGLDKAVRECMPNVAHMACVQHISANMCKTTNAEASFEKKYLWEAASASTAAEFEHIMTQQIQPLWPRAYAYLRGIPTKVWCFHTAVEAGVMTYGQVREVNPSTYRDPYTVAMRHDV